MIKLIETCTKKTGETETKEKTFKSWSDFKRVIVASPMSTELTYNLLKHREAFIDYEDARVHLKVVEEKPAVTLLDSAGQPIHSIPNRGT